MTPLLKHTYRQLNRLKTLIKYQHNAYFNISFTVLLKSPSGIFPLGFPEKVLLAFLISFTRFTRHIYLTFFAFVAVMIFEKENELCCLSQCNSLHFAVNFSVSGPNIPLIPCHGIVASMNEIVV